MSVVRRRLASQVVTARAVNFRTSLTWRGAALSFASFALALVAGDAPSQSGGCARCGSAPVAPEAATPQRTAEPRRMKRVALRFDLRSERPKRGAFGGSYVVCVRACDGSFFPVSYFGGTALEVQEICQSLCPSATVALYSLPFGGTIDEAVCTFTDVTKAAGLDKDVGWATGVAFGDYDGDGDSDLFVAHYVDLDLNDLPSFGSKKTCQYHDIAVQCGPRGLKGFPDTLYHNNGDGTFTEVAKQTGVDDSNRFFGLGVVWSDFDNDGKLDLFVANDGEPNYLYHNLGNGRFQDVALDAGVSVSEEGVEQANMGLALGDYLHTGWMSILITHFSEEYATLYRNDGGLSFTDVSHAAGIARATAPFVGWGDAFLDLDNSGWLDIIMVNGHVYPQVDNGKTGTAYREPKLVFQNQRDGTFKNVSSLTGSAVTVPQVSRGLAVGDLFNKGRLDIVVENLTGAPMILEAKSNPSHHWVSFELEGSPVNRLALNARVRVTTGKVQQLGEVRSGGSYLSQNDLRMHFGLEDAAQIDKVEVSGRMATRKSSMMSLQTASTTSSKVELCLKANR